MFHYSVCIITLCFILPFICCDEESVAHIVASKDVLNHFIVENKDLTLIYKLYNIGSFAAYEVELKDENFAPDYFKVKAGSLSTRWPHLAAGSNVTHTVILQPLSAGMFNFTSALISYKAKQEDKTVTFGYSSIPGELLINTLQNFNKHHSSHLMDWMTFGLICTPSLLIPFMLWYISKSKYDTKPKSKSH